MEVASSRTAYVRMMRPKQLLKLFSGTSLLRQSYERVAALLPPDQINVITSQAHVSMVAEELPELPTDVGAVAAVVQDVDARLVVVDPLVAYLPGSVNSW